MKFFKQSVFSALLTFVLLVSGMIASAVEFPNPSLDEDVENDKVPDKWLIPASSQVNLVTDKVSHGLKAARFDSGYVLLNCSMKEENLPGLKLAFSFDAAGEGDAALGVMLGYFIMVNGKLKFSYSRLAWDKKLTADYKTMSFAFTFPASAVKERIWFGVYRSNKKGVVWLDNFKISSWRGKPLTSEQSKKLTVLSREYNYLESRINEALKRKPGNASLLNSHKQLVEVKARILKQDAALCSEEDKLNEDIKNIDAGLNRLLADGQDNIAWLDDAYTRLKADDIIPDARKTSVQVVSLGNEYQAAGIVVANCENKTVNLAFAAKGLEQAADKIKVRRQVFQQNWYQKEKERMTDALVLLPEKQGVFDLTLEPGEIVKLYLSFKVKKDISGEFPVNIKLGDSKLDLTLKVIKRNLPETPFFANFQCIYPEINPAGRHPDLAADDMAEHYTTAIEFPYLPPVTFNKDGSIAKENFKQSRQFKWMKAYCAKGIKLALFWQGGYDKFPLVDSKEKLPFTDKNMNLLPEWKKAYSNLLQAWLDFARKEGYKTDDFISWGMDELASHDDFDSAPGKKVRLGVEVYKTSRKAVPDLPTLVTAGNYSLYEDVMAFLPEVDIILPAWPLPVELPRWAPKGYNPRKVFFDKTLKALEAERRKRGLIVWSYKVDCGKKEPVINGRAYPLCAVGIGFTGVGSWAYNCSRGLSWDDTDKGLLDYSFIYDGEENHPVNKKYNVTGEIIVPSIRWEAFRMGIQDAKILLYLKDQLEKGKCDSETGREIKTLLDETNEYGRKMNYNFDKINKVSVKIRELVSKLGR